MDQAALQRVALARSSRTPCGIRSYLVGSLVGRVVFFLDFLADPIVLLCCNALQVLCLGAPEQSSSYYTAPVTVHVLVKS